MNKQLSDNADLLGWKVAATIRGEWYPDNRWQSNGNRLTRKGGIEKGFLFFKVEGIFEHREMLMEGAIKGRSSKYRRSKNIKGPKKNGSGWSIEQR